MKILYLSYENQIDLEKEHDVFYLNRFKMNDMDWRRAVDEFDPELVLEREFNDGMAVYTDVYEWMRANHPHCRLAVWLIDTHVSYERHLEYAKHFDYIFIAISSYVYQFREVFGDKVFWLPVCYPYPRDEIRRNYGPIIRDIVFVGNVDNIKKWFPERSEHIEFLRDHYKDKFYAVTDYDNMKEIIRTAKVSFNYCIRDDMNFRVFETLGLGTELVTNDVSDLHKILGLTDRISIYRDKSDLVRIIDGILDNSSTTDTLEAQEWVKARHTYHHRCKSMLKMMATNQQEYF
jgi:spore maturation protein CgeB